MQIAYAELPEHLRAKMAKETLCGSLGLVPLQQHLLAAQPENMEEAVKYSNEFLQVKGDRLNRGRGDQPSSCSGSRPNHSAYAGHREANQKSGTTGRPRAEERRQS